MKAEKENALFQQKISLQNEAENTKNQMLKLHQKDLQKKSREIERKEQQMKELREELKQEQDAHKETKERLDFVLASYQNFIDNQPGFSKGQAEYLLKDFCMSQ